MRHHKSFRAFAHTWPRLSQGMGTFPHNLDSGQHTTILFLDIMYIVNYVYCTQNANFP